MFCYMKVCLENKGTKASVHRNFVPQLKHPLSTKGFYEDMCEPGDSNVNGHFFPSAEPDSPAIPPSGL